MEGVYNKAIKCRIYPNAAQQIMLAKTFGCVRYVYNHFLDYKKSLYETKKEPVSCNTTIKLLKDLKQSNDFLYEVDSIALQQSLRHLDTAYKNFFTKKETGYPKFKKKMIAQSYTTVVTNNNIRVTNNYIKIPKVGFVKIKLHRNIPADWKLKSITVRRSSTEKYYVSMLFEFIHNVNPVSIDKDTSAIGLDFSMKKLFVSSNDLPLEYPQFYKKTMNQLAKKQRKLSHCEKQSHNYNKQRKIVAKIHEKIRNQRLDFLHKLSREITNLYDIVCIEDLDMKVMSQSLNFGKSVLDDAWGTFTALLKYKLEFEGKHLVKIDKWFPSSKICSNCGCIKELTLQDRVYKCKCGLTIDRDLNAAINIKNEGLRLFLQAA